MAIGFNRELFILPFDHRGSFQEKLLGIRDRAPNAEEAETITRLKRIVFNGFKLALDRGVPRESAGVLIDEQFGSGILEEARACGIPTAVCVEKSGQAEFDFEYGERFREHIARLEPTFVKALVRYNPDADPSTNLRSRKRLKLLADF
jgi:5-dehydro-2-deoxygluconokinase